MLGTNCNPTISIVDMQGKIMFENTYSLNSGNNEISLNIQPLNNGVYYILLSSDKINESIIFKKQ